MLKKLWKDESGQGLVEYSLIIALVAIGLILALTNLKDAISGVFGDVETELEGATE